MLMKIGDNPIVCAGSIFGNANGLKHYNELQKEDAGRYVIRLLIFMIVILALVT